MPYIFNTENPAEKVDRFTLPLYRAVSAVDCANECDRVGRSCLSYIYVPSERATISCFLLSQQYYKKELLFESHLRYYVKKGTFLCFYQ